ncbi:hypothetical protein BU16DRAFT_535524 [Lophium mytilinum]|uniref:Uncharacterized protein n=1 Tax=Lophium mytilinum TaxID=390894 RepID=A0A6A6R3K2_9PEZI|nr:hypothetical protein BU16DRAFT_535524 [Lophium mytilinum]
MDRQLRNSNTLTPIVTPTPTRTPAKDALVLRAVNSAAQRSESGGRPNVGKALRRLYDESRFNYDNAKLLDAVLRMRATPLQQANFRGFIRRERKASKKRERKLNAVKTQATSQHDLPMFEPPSRSPSAPPPFNTQSPTNRHRRIDRARASHSLAPRWRAKIEQSYRARGSGRFSRFANDRDRRRR